MNYEFSDVDYCFSLFASLSIYAPKDLLWAREFGPTSATG